MAILAYAAAPRALRAHLETLILQIDGAVIDAQNRLHAGSDPATCQAVATLATEEIKPLIAAASGTIHGREEGEDDFADETSQADIDALFG